MMPKMDRAAKKAEIEGHLEARVTVLETEVRRHEFSCSKRQAAEIMAVQQIIVPSHGRLEHALTIGGHRARNKLFANALKLRISEMPNLWTLKELRDHNATLQDEAPYMWNAHVKTTTPKAAHAMPWVALKKMMTNKYCLRVNQLRVRLRCGIFKVKGTDVVRYIPRFQQLALMCFRMFPEEIDKIEKYIGGLPDMIHGSVKASKPKTMQEAIEFTTELKKKVPHPCLC
ncbi:hypothetical protein Tco_0168800 [Tanacetum coccineum]